MENELLHIDLTEEELAELLEDLPIILRLLEDEACMNLNSGMTESR